MNFNKRLEDVERRKRALPRQCGRGLKLAQGTPARWCSQHGYGCWLRFSAREEAQVQMALAELERRKATGTAKWDSDVEALLHGEPPDTLVAQCREFLVSEGYELEED